MARNSSSALLRSLLLSRKNKPFSSASIKALTTSTQISSSSFGNLLDNQMKPLSSFASLSFRPSISPHQLDLSVLLHHLVSTDLDDKLPTIFYFTAVWCPPCRLISPVIESLSKKYPHVTTLISIRSQPTIHLFQNGKKADEMVGADVARLKQIVERLYSTKNN
ncbi:thioredoxin-3-like [Papaver somniferum]|uniref:thioredoxin-3-like n=1 Tax=Papaver somniferum TaxID=3469 RepID=UPI000E6F9CA1|nr:thioredoxin-3-like [Papaver somniferum]